MEMLAHWSAYARVGEISLFDTRESVMSNHTINFFLSPLLDLWAQKHGENEVLNDSTSGICTGDD